MKIEIVIVVFNFKDLNYKGKIFLESIRVYVRWFKNFFEIGILYNYENFVKRCIFYDWFCCKVMVFIIIILIYYIKRFFRVKIILGFFFFIFGSNIVMKNLLLFLLVVCWMYMWYKVNLLIMFIVLKIFKIFNYWNFNVYLCFIIRYKGRKYYYNYYYNLKG